MSGPGVGMGIVTGSMDGYAQLNNCRVCRRVSAKVCNASCCRIYSFCSNGQLIGFVSMSLPRSTQKSEDSASRTILGPVISNAPPVLFNMRAVS